MCFAAVKLNRQRLKYVPEELLTHKFKEIAYNNSYYWICLKLIFFNMWNKFFYLLFFKYIKIKKKMS